MASPLDVKILTIDSIENLPGSDRLMLAKLQGWECVVGKKEDGSAPYKTGQLVAYIPPDSIITPAFAEKLGVTKYVAKNLGSDGSTVLRVRTSRIRGAMSFGIVFDPLEFGLPDELYNIGQDVAEFFGVTKYEPAKHGGKKIPQGDCAPEHPLFPRYTSLRNLRQYSNVFTPGEQVYIDEKFHGTNCRVGIVSGEKMAGSHNHPRKAPVVKDIVFTGKDVDFKSTLADEVMSDEVQSPTPVTELGDGWWMNDAVCDNLYWFPWTDSGVRAMLEELSAEYNQVVLFGEVTGTPLFFAYGQEPGKLAFRAFDLMLNGEYVNRADFIRQCAHYGISTVTNLYIGPYSDDVVKRLAIGTSTVSDDIREGVVIRPEFERIDSSVGRVAMKYINDEYLLSKEKKSDAGLLETVDAVDE